VTVELLTAQGGLLALAVLVPLVAFIGISRRAARTRAALGLPEPPPRQRLLPLAALLAVAALLGLAAMQPVLERSTTNTVRRDAEVFMVVDISRSMLARRSPGAPSRLDRAKVAGARLRTGLPDVPVGIASMTNRVLPHLFPSGDADVFRATLERAIGIERPPPGSSFLTPQQEALRQATTFASLAGVATRRFFSPQAKQRLLVVLTDGETTRVSEADVGRRLRGARIETVFIHVWSASERVFRKGVPERRYAPDPTARSNLESLALATEGSVYDETSVGSAASKARELLGNGPTVAQGVRPDRMALAPYLALAAAFPLTFLLWRRDR
jgi:hypothetical protein